MGEISGIRPELLAWVKSTPTQLLLELCQKKLDAANKNMRAYNLADPNHQHAATRAQAQAKIYADFLNTEELVNALELLTIPEGETNGT